LESTNQGWVNSEVKVVAKLFYEFPIMEEIQKIKYRLSNVPLIEFCSGETISVTEKLSRNVSAYKIARSWVLPESLSTWKVSGQTDELLVIAFPWLLVFDLQPRHHLTGNLL
jgi:hypothetical protein